MEELHLSWVNVAWIFTGRVCWYGWVYCGYGSISDLTFSKLVVPSALSYTTEVGETWYGSASNCPVHLALRHLNQSSAQAETLEISIAV